MPRLWMLMALVLLSACQVTRMQPGIYSAEQVRTLEENGFTRNGDDWELGFDNRVLFASDESSLQPGQVAMLDRLGKALLAVGIRGARVAGHTDSTGSASHNESLSLRRAESVKAAMVAAGMDSAAVRAIGMGARAPIESNDSAAGRLQNRRVVITVSPGDVVRLD